MKCWICREEFDSLSREHIIPRTFDGMAIAKEFSCRKCNGIMGEWEAPLGELAVFMGYLVSSSGVGDVPLPKGESKKKARSVLIGKDLKTRVSTDGMIRSGGMVGYPASERRSADLVVSDPFTFQVDRSRIMLKALLALASEVGFRDELFAEGLAHLGGDGDVLDGLEPLSLGIAPRELVARVWLIAPGPSGVLFGVVVYGPMCFLYKLASNSGLAFPFVFELRALEKKFREYVGWVNYSRWREGLMGEVGKGVASSFLGFDGVYGVRRSETSGLIYYQTSPALAGRVLGTGGIDVPWPGNSSVYRYEVRFENWLEAVGTERGHSEFLAEAREFDRRVMELRGIS